MPTSFPNDINARSAALVTQAATATELPTQRGGRRWLTVGPVVACGIWRQSLCGHTWPRWRRSLVLGSGLQKGRRPPASTGSCQPADDDRSAVAIIWPWLNQLLAGDGTTGLFPDNPQQTLGWSTNVYRPVVAGAWRHLVVGSHAWRHANIASLVQALIVVGGLHAVFALIAGQLLPEFPVDRGYVGRIRGTFVYPNQAAACWRAAAAGGTPGLSRPQQNGPLASLALAGADRIGQSRYFNRGGGAGAVLVGTVPNNTDCS